MNILKKVTGKVILLGVLLVASVLPQTVFGEDLGPDAECSLTIYSDRNDYYNQASATSPCTGYIIGYYSKEMDSFETMGAYTGTVKDGEIYVITIPSKNLMNVYVTIHTVKVAQKPKPEPVITTKTTTSTESIGFKTIEQKDSSLDKGKTIVVQEGKAGVLTITYKETYEDGKLVSKDKVSSKVTRQPIDKIVKVGTKELEPEPQPSQPSTNGETKQPNSTTQKVSATTKPTTTTENKEETQESIETKEDEVVDSTGTSDEKEEVIEDESLTGKEEEQELTASNDVESTTKHDNNSPFAKGKIMFSILIALTFVGSGFYWWFRKKNPIK